MTKLERWKPGNVPNQQGPAMRPEDEFAEALRALGCIVDGQHPIMDGAKHRIVVEGDKANSSERSGFYVGHLDGHPAGYIKNNRTGVDMNGNPRAMRLIPKKRLKCKRRRPLNYVTVKWRYRLNKRLLLWIFLCC